MKRLIGLFSLLFLFLLPVPPAHADGGLAVQPYWTFATDAPVTHVQTADINGDGLPEIIIATADNWVSVIDSEGKLIWRYEAGTKVNDLAAVDLDGDGQKVEIFVGGDTQDTLLSNLGKPIQTSNFSIPEATLLVFVADLDGDGREELIKGNPHNMAILNSELEVVDNSYATGRPVSDVWVGQVDGDGRPEIVPNLAGGDQVYLFDYRLKPIWQQPIEGEVGLVQGGDVDGDGQAELVVLSNTGDLFLLESDGRQIWRQPVRASGQVVTKPSPGQLLVQDLDGDGQAEIVVWLQAIVYAFDGQGHQLWQQPFGIRSSQESRMHSGLPEGNTQPQESEFQARLLSGDTNGDGQAELLVASPQQGAVYLLAADGHRLAEYSAEGATGALAYGDLNGDGQAEIVVGLKTGLRVFGLSQRVAWQQLWQSPFLGFVTTLEVADTDGDGQSNLVVGSRVTGEGQSQISSLTLEGHILSQATFEEPILAFGAGDVNGDGRAEFVVATHNMGPRKDKIQLLEGNNPGWTTSIYGSYFNKYV